MRPRRSLVKINNACAARFSMHDSYAWMDVNEMYIYFTGTF